MLAGRKEDLQVAENSVNNGADFEQERNEIKERKTVVTSLETSAPNKHWNRRLCFKSVT